MKRYMFIRDEINKFMREVKVEYWKDIFSKIEKGFSEFWRIVK